jgi:ferritin-like metal-binding protein YciE
MGEGMTGTITTQLARYLSDAHAIEEQALAQLRSAPGMAGDDRLAAALTEHLRETEMHERLVHERLDALGESPSRWKDLIMAAGGKGFLAFARSQPDTPGKLAAHAYAYEHLEIAAYELLARVARQAGDPETEVAAARILPDERRMAERLEALFDDTARSSLAAVGSTDANEQVPVYLSDAHALEQQSIGLLRRVVDVSAAPELADAYRAHLAQSERHAVLLERRLGDLGRSPSAVKDAAMRIGAVNWATFFKAQSDTTGKVAAFAYAFEHLEIAGYEQLRRVAEIAGDADTVRVADRIGADERAAAATIATHWDIAAQAALAETGAR